ncbi:ribosome hibernation-promoting factor, HPF/YfiA family [Litorihabitans aurantiacus]|uniref:Ribosome hibernation promoting factor n=1 Tax=Litorihabitans aurantiacus TaxID=1930061 RepID=A0AA37UMD7_9MICO|nr:ribosome-associated translation inhibitor RaiA [Litorihabitans aurantiacus]GMA30649.1 ribosomal subunit interface protein [Litorihabitans aurantiacus]
MEIVVVGRHTEVAPRFRKHVEDKLSKVTQLAPYAQRVDVEISHEPNPRQAASSERIELTVRDRGPVVRAEASASDRYAALDVATTKLIERLRRSHDRRKGKAARREGKAPVAAEEALAALDAAIAPAPQEAPEQDVNTAPTEPDVAVEAQLGDSPVVVRQKVHRTSPVSVEDAIDEMELAGHPFYLFIDAETRQPAVVYHRHGWTYGVIRLDAEAAPTS